MRVTRGWIAVAAAGMAAAFAQGEGPELDLKEGTLAAAEYARADVRGFTVHVAPTLGAKGSLASVGGQALEALDRDLAAALEQVPEGARQALLKVPIYLGEADPVAPCACYHPSAGWLDANGYDPAKAKAVEISRAATYLDWRRSQPSMLLHELAHAYHDQVVGKRNERVASALARARQSGAYDRVLRWSGETGSHYALTNTDEYFAETTEALFGVNDFFPFIRPELLQVDPEGAALVAELWGAVPPAPPKGAMEALVRAEIPRLHAAFEAWYDKDRSPPEFKGISGALTRGFQMVSTSGQVIGRKGTLALIRGAKGSRLVRISVEIQSVLPIGLDQAMAIYHERQLEAGVERVIVSTALFRRAPEAPGGVEWVHVHETLSR